MSDLVHLPGEVSRFLIHVSASETTENHSDFFAFFASFFLKFLSSEETPEEPPPVTDSATLKHFAREAEVSTVTKRL